MLMILEIKLINGSFRDLKFHLKNSGVVEVCPDLVGLDNNSNPHFFHRTFRSHNDGKRSEDG
jgi:hypothetical protein